MSKKQDIREEFRKQVYRRDNHKCVVPWCNKDAVDAHHIIERALWIDKGELGGYLKDNGASVCEYHHRHAEADFFPPEALREWIRDYDTIERIIPNQLDPLFWYTKWGVKCSPPTREYCKYPSTIYLPFSPGVDPADVKKIGFADLSKFLHKPLVVTVKMDGSNTTLKPDGPAARNGEDALGESFDMLKSYFAALSYQMNKNLQYFGEWLYAKHSIHYKHLTTLFQLFAVYNPKSQLWLSFDDVLEASQKLSEIHPDMGIVPIINWSGGIVDRPERLWDNYVHTFKKEHELIYKLTEFAEDAISRGHEGIVVRSRYPFHYSQFTDNVAKYVRAGHVQDDAKHWSKQPLVKNLKAS